MTKRSNAWKLSVTLNDEPLVAIEMDKVYRRIKEYSPEQFNALKRAHHQLSVFLGEVYLEREKKEKAPAYYDYCVSAALENAGEGPTQENASR